MVQETHLRTDDFIAPLFIIEGNRKREKINSMPGYCRLSLDETLREIEELLELGIKAVLLFVKVPNEKKDKHGTEALNSGGLMQRSIRQIKQQFPEILVFSDVALDPYSNFGHDGIVEDGQILNDESVEILEHMALSHAEAGVDIVAPSDMMDGRIAAIRQTLDANAYSDTGILSYAAKYASAFYGPFRDALDSAPGFGDKKTYQMNPANAREALTEIELDLAQGADIIMIKPGLPYLDIIRQIRIQISQPLAAYQVSGEYAMIKAASQHGWLNEKETVMESLLALKRAGADIIATYFAKHAARWIKEQH